MSTPPLIYVITLNWNRCQDTITCLEALQRLSYPSKKILLVDNASTDNTVQTVKHSFPNIEIIINDENLGFGAGFNVGLRYAIANNAAYIFIINNDAIPATNVLEQLVTAFEEGVGIVGPKIYFYDNPKDIWTVGGMCHPLTIEKIDDAFGQPDIGQWETIIDRDYLVGCALLMSRSLLEEIGLFDERFFLYYEDSDLALRARQANYRLLLAPKAHVWHKIASSSGGLNSPSERYWMARSSVSFFSKHISGFRWFIVIPFRIGSAIRTTFALLINKQPKALKAYFSGLWQGFLDLRNKQEV